MSGDGPLINTTIVFLYLVDLTGFGESARGSFPALEGR